MAGSSGVAAAERIDVLSPELVLVDPALREAWQRLPDPSPEPREEPASAVDDTAAAVRSLARVALDADVEETRRRRRRVRPLHVVAAVSAAGALAVIGFLAAAAGPGVDEPAVAGAPGAPTAAADIAVPTKAVSSPRPVRAVPPSGTTARRFVWAPVDDATGYHVELFLRDERVFAKRTTAAEVEIPDEWRFEGRRHELEAVTYDWYVWPVVEGRRAAAAIVQATLVVRDR
jgi:hypothetical protein